MVENHTFHSKRSSKPELAKTSHLLALLNQAPEDNANPDKELVVYLLSFKKTNKSLFEQAVYQTFSYLSTKGNPRAYQKIESLLIALTKLDLDVMVMSDLLTLIQAGQLNMTLLNPERLIYLVSEWGVDEPSAKQVSLALLKTLDQNTLGQMTRDYLLETKNSLVDSTYSGHWIVF